MEIVDGVGEGGDLEGEDERNSSTSPLPLLGFLPLLGVR